MTNCNRKISQYSEYTGLTPSDLIFPVVDTSIYSNFNLPYDNLVAAIQGSLSGSGIYNIFLSGDTTLVAEHLGGGYIYVDLLPLLNYVTYEFTGNTSATCISDLYVHNLAGCSPINVLTDIYTEKAISGGTFHGDGSEIINGKHANLSDVLGGDYHLTQTQYNQISGDTYYSKNIDFIYHTGDTNNPHSVTASQINAYTKTETDQWLASKISHSASTAANDFLVGSGSNTFIKKTLNETKAILGIGHSLTSSTINTTTNSVTDVALANMYVIPGAGTYIVWFVSTYSNSNTNGTTTFSIYANNSLISSEAMTNPAANTLYPVHVLNQVTVTDDQAIEIRWKASANTSTCWSRTLTLIKIA